MPAQYATENYFLNNEKMDTACINGDLMLIQRMIDRGISLNPMKNNFLYKIIKCDHLHVLQHFLKYGDIDSDYIGRIIQYYGSDNFGKNIKNYLLGLDDNKLIKTICMCGQNFLHSEDVPKLSEKYLWAAFTHGSLETLNFLLQNGLKYDLLNIFLSSKIDQLLKKIRSLMKHGIKMTGKSSLFRMANYTDVVEYLINCGTVLNEEELSGVCHSSCCTNIKTIRYLNTKYQFTDIHLRVASESKNYEVVKYLVDKGLNGLTHQSKPFIDFINKIKNRKASLIQRWWRLNYTRN